MKNRKPISEPRDTTVNIRVSKSEKAQLNAAASELGISVGGYLLGLALGDSFSKPVYGVSAAKKRKEE